jgi:hypothetical protein
MVTTANDFEEEIAWERTILALAVPLTRLTSSQPTLDRRTSQINITMTASIGAPAEESIKDALLPLLFGAAWKVIDIAVELALANAGCILSSSGRWTIQGKNSAIQTGGSLSGISPTSDLWLALRQMYVATTEPRHALVHRRVTVDQATQTLSCFDKTGSLLAAISASEQMAFCRVSQRLADAIVAAHLSLREELDFRALLALLNRLHGVNITGAMSDRPPIRILDDFPADGKVDIPTILNEARHTFPENKYFDVEFYLPDGRRLLGEIDRAPSQVLAVDLDNLPVWLSFI